MRENFPPLPFHLISCERAKLSFSLPHRPNYVPPWFIGSGKKLFLYGGNGLTTSNPFPDMEKNLCVLAWFCTLDWKRSPTWCCVQKFATNSLVASVFLGNLLRLQRTKMRVQTPTPSWVFLFHVLHMHALKIFLLGSPRRNGISDFPNRISQKTKKKKWNRYGSQED